MAVSTMYYNVRMAPARPPRAARPLPVLPQLLELYTLYFILAVLPSCSNKSDDTRCFVVVSDPDEAHNLGEWRFEAWTPDKARYTISYHTILH